MTKQPVLIVLVSMGLATACQPRRAPADPARATGPGATPLSPKAARILAKRFTDRARQCYAQVYRVSLGRDVTQTDLKDAARQARALRRLGAELRSCLTGSGYRGEAMVSGAVVKRWLGARDCAGFARAAFASRACFALAGVLDQVGYLAARSRRRAASPGGQRGAAARSCATPQPPTAHGHYAASHILIFYRGARRAPARITRSKAAARQLANRIVALVRAPGADFAKLARRWSEGPTARRGGRLGRFGPQRMVPPFSAAVKQLCIGGVSGVVETRFGFHIIKRDPP